MTLSIVIKISLVNTDEDKDGFKNENFVIGILRSFILLKMFHGMKLVHLNECTSGYTKR